MSGRVLRDRIAAAVVGAVIVAAVTPTAAAAATAPSVAYVSQFGDGGDAAGQFDGPEQLAVDASSGDTYVVDFLNDRVEEFDSAGDYVTAFGSPGSGSGQLDGPEGIAVGPSNGDVYVADYGNDRVDVFSASGTYLSSFGTAGDGDGQFEGPYGIATDADGNVYVDDYGERVEKFTAGGTYASQFATGADGANTPEWLAIDSTGGYIYVDDTGGGVSRHDLDGSGATSFSPTNMGACNGAGASRGIAVNPATGDVYISGSAGYVVNEYTSSGSCVREIGNYGIPDSGAGYFLDPWGLAFDPSTGDLSVADERSNDVQVFSSAGASLLTFGGGGGAAPANLDEPVSVATDPATGDVWVGDSGVYPTPDGRDDAAIEFGPAGGYQLSIMTLNVGDDENLTSPWGLAVDPSDSDLYVSNWEYGDLERWSSAGAFLENYGFPGPEGTPTEPAKPAGISVDPANSDLYVPDLSNDAIDVFSPSHASLKQFGSSGSDPGEFDGPSATAFDPTDDDLYVLDEGNDRVEKFTAAGSYLLSFGGKGDGNGQFEYDAGSAEGTDTVGGLAVDPSTGDVYVTDTNDNRVEVFSSTGQYLAQFGGLGAAHGDFQGPSDIAISSTNGDIYVTDEGNLRVEIFHALEPTTVGYTGPDSGIEGQPVTLTASLSSGGSPLGGQPVTIGFGAESCTATTDSGGVAACVVTPSDAPGGSPYPVTTSFAGSGYYEPSADSNGRFTVEAPSSSTGGGSSTTTTSTTTTPTTTAPTTTGTKRHKPTNVSPRASAGTYAVIVKLACPIADRSCVAAITLDTVQKVAVRVGRRLKHEIVTVGRGRFTIAGGRRRTVTVRLDARGRALLTKLRTLKLRVIVSAHDAYREPHTVSLHVKLKAPQRRRGR